MKLPLLLALVGFGLEASAALKPVPTRQSEQFVVRDLRSLAPPNPSWKPRPGAIQLEPDVVLLSAERIRQTLYSELGIPPRGGQRIDLRLTRASENHQQMLIVPEFFTDGWQYRVDIPDRLEGLRWIRGIVEVVLIEYANRGSGPKSAEIPLWLNEGLSFHLSASCGPDLIFKAVPPGMMAQLVRDSKGVDSLRETREFLREHTAFSFAELSHLTPWDLSSESFKVFQHSAHLLVNELARLPNGRAGLLKMLQALPRYWNWENAFLQAFQPRFEQMLDVEKWWSVHLLAFTGRDPTQTWPADLCLQRLDEILVSAAEVRLATNTLPVRTQATLQQIIVEWSFAQQRPVLEQAQNQLVALRFNCPVEIIPLVDRHRMVLRQYLQNRARANASSLAKRDTAVPARLLIQTTIQQLDELLREREALRRNRMTATDVFRADGR